jgi:fumarate hydratase class II
MTLEELKELKTDDDILSCINDLEDKNKALSESQFSKENVEKIQSALDVLKEENAKVKADFEKLKTDYNNAFVEKITDDVLKNQHNEETEIKPTIADLFTE